MDALPRSQPAQQAPEEPPRPSPPRVPSPSPLFMAVARRRAPFARLLPAIRPCVPPAPPLPVATPETLRLPWLEVDAPPRSRDAFDVDPSIIYQVDALTFACRGVRPDIDFFADEDSSFCEFRPWSPFDDLASFTALFLHEFKFLPAAVAAAATHRALAFFVVPVQPGAPHFI